MADRLEPIRAHVLDFIADDFEEIGQIMIDMGRWNAELGASREDVKVALMSLLKDGLAKAYDLHSSQVPLQGLPPAESFEQHYFYITPRGRDVMEAFPDEWFRPSLTKTSPRRPSC